MATDRLPDIFATWQTVLVERTRAAIDAFADVTGVVGLILAGSIGRDEPWPLSDIDLLPIYEDDGLAEAVAAVEARRVELLDHWAPEGALCTSLDIGKLRFSRAEVQRVLATPPATAATLLDDPRWFHSLDKGYRGRAAFDPLGLAAPLADWLTEARFAPAVVEARRAANERGLLARRRAAVDALAAGDAMTAAINLRECLHLLMRWLMEGWGERDASWARFGARFDRVAARGGWADVAAEVWALYQLTPPAVAQRLASAPAGIRGRHAFAYAARRLVGEPVTALEDARDVLLVFATWELRARRPPYAAWVGLVTEPDAVADHLRRLDGLLARVGIDHR